MDYLSFRKEVDDAGLLNRQYLYYAWKVFVSFSLIFILGLLLMRFNNIFFQLGIVIALTFAFLQFAFLGHDAGHFAVFKSKRNNNFLGLLSLSLICGVSYSYWFKRHNAHHTSPNHEEYDPDFVAFAQTEEELLRKKGVMRFLYERQHWLYLPILSFYMFSFHMQGAIYNMKIKNQRYKWLELVLMVAHFALVWVLPFFFLAWWKAVTFVIMLRLLMGIYFGAVSATNHKGMRVIRKGEKLGFFEKQILTTRNVKGNILVDYIYGGLNYQMEHHMFPNMPRNNLRKCRPYLMKFCVVNNIPYVETGVVRSYQLILGHLKDVVMSARRKTVA